MVMLAGVCKEPLVTKVVDDPFAEEHEAEPIRKAAGA